MKSRLLDIVKGFLIGLDSTIPGFSIGTLAILLNIYERLIEDFSDILKHPFKIIRKDLWLGVGFIIGLVLNIISVTWLLSHYPLETVSFFVGLVLVSIPTTYKKTKIEKRKIRDFITFFVSLGVLVGITLLNAGTEKGLTMSALFIIMILFMGAIGSGTMIIPGVSGSLIIMAFGYYNVIMDVMHDFLSAFVHFDFTGFGAIIITILVFMVGVIIGIVFISKLIKFLLNKVPGSVYHSILGLLIGSPFAIYYLTINKYEINFDSPWVYIISVLSLALGVLFGIFMLKVENKNNKDIDNKQNDNIENLENKEEVLKEDPTYGATE